MEVKRQNLATQGGPANAGPAAASAAALCPVQQNGFRPLWKPLLNDPLSRIVALSALEPILSDPYRGLWWVHFE